jgi:hypothetical protein
LAQKPKKPLAQCENNERVPLATPSPTPDASVGEFRKADDGAITKSLIPEAKEVNNIVGLPTKSKLPIIL